MVPNLSKGAGIKGAALYVLKDKDGEGSRAIGAEPTPAHQVGERVGMTATRNLSTDDPDLAWRLMCTTAANRDALKQAAGVRTGGRQTKNFCGHLALSWEHETKPDRAEMLRAAEGALTALGWEKLQALIVEHKDHEHSHCHIVVCLIDPETGRTAPNAKNDYEKLQRWAHEYDKARGIEVCPNRAERMERAPDAPPPSEPAKRWATRQEYEAIRDTERAEHRTQALDRYRTAAAEVKEQFRPEWAELYRAQRAELRTFDREAKQRFTNLDQATHPDHILAFYNANRERIWRGIGPGEQPGNTHTLLTPGFMRKALDRADRVDKFVMTEQHGMAKVELQDRHTEARQEAYRAAWQRPSPADVVPFSQQAQPSKSAPLDQPAGDSPKVGLAAALAISAAGIAVYALSRNREQNQTRDPQRDLDQAAARIARQPQRAANTNQRPTPDAKPQPEPESAKAKPEASGSLKPRSELDELRAQAAAANEAARLAHQAAAQRRQQRGPSRDRTRD